MATSSSDVSAGSDHEIAASWRDREPGRSGPSVHGSGGCRSFGVDTAIRAGVTRPERSWMSAAIIGTVAVHESRVTGAQNSVGPGACFEGASVDPTDARKALYPARGGLTRSHESRIVLLSRRIPGVILIVMSRKEDHHGLVSREVDRGPTADRQ